MAEKKKVRIVVGGREFQSLDEVPEELRPELEKQLLEALESDESGLAPSKRSQALPPESSRLIPMITALIVLAAVLLAYFVFFKR